MQKGLIGVVVPVYKVEKYIAECIDSILAQTYTNFHLILVDDGSPDDAGYICDEYAKKDPRITVIHQENAGVTRARARGVEEAEDCEFIMFVDSDDKLLPNALEEFYSKTDDCTDIIMNTCYYINDNKIFTYYSYKGTEIIDFKYFVRRNIYLDGGEPWGKLYRRSLFNKEIFNIPREIFCGEDVLMNIRVAFKSKSNIRTIDKPVYIHRIHDESVFYNFKQNPEYEEVFRENLEKSIPRECFTEYTNEYIGSRVLRWRMFGGNCLKKPEWAGTRFHKQLKKDVKVYGFSLPYFEKLLLYHTNQPLRAIIFFGRKICSFFKKKNYKQIDSIKLQV